MTFPCNSFVLELDDAELTAIIRQSTAKRISEKRVTYLVDKLTKLANQSYCEVKKTSPMMEEIKYYAGELLRLSEYRQGVLEEMVTLAQPLPEYFSLFLESLKPQRQVLLANLVTFVNFILPIKSML